SHSSARGLCNHSRNLDDEQLQWLKGNGGVIQTVAFNSYVDMEKHKLYNDAVQQIYRKVGEKMDFVLVDGWDELRAMEEDERKAWLVKYEQVKELSAPQVEKLKETVPPVDVADFVDHIDYMVEKIGIE